MTKIDSAAMRYVCQCILLMLIASVICFTTDATWHFGGMKMAVAISVSYGIIIETIDAIIWRKVATHAADSLPTFFMAVSMFRMLIAIGVMMTYYLVTKPDSSMTFFVVFLVFCLIMIAHHALFFIKTKQ